MKYIFSCLILLLIGFSSCKERVRYEIIQVPSLPLNDLYTPSLMHQFVADHSNNESVAVSYFEKAQSLYAENPQKGIYLVQRALTIYPKKVYYETLARYFMDQKKYDDARMVLQYLVEQYVDNGNRLYVFDKPSKDLVVDYYTSKVLSGIYIDSYEIASFSKETNVPISEYRDLLLNSKLLSVEKDSWLYKNIRYLFLEDGSSKEYLKGEENFKNVLASIPEVQSSLYSIGEDRVAAVRKNLDDFEEGDMSFNYNLPNVHGAELFTYESQSQDESEGSGYFVPYFTERIQFSPNCIGLVYSKDSSVSGCPKEMREIVHVLVLYNSNGLLQDHLRAAWQVGDRLALVEINTKGTIKQEMYKRNWEKPYAKDDEDNHYNGKDYSGTQSYRIDIKTCKVKQDEADIVEIGKSDL